MNHHFAFAHHDRQVAPSKVTHIGHQGAGGGDVTFAFLIPPRRRRRGGERDGSDRGSAGSGEDQEPPPTRVLVPVPGVPVKTPRRFPYEVCLIAFPLPAGV